MSCFTRLQKTHQLQCNFPELTGTRSIAAYFTPTKGTERRVSDCVLLDDLDCNNEKGFKCEVLSSEHAVFTLPEYFDAASGSFRCQTPGLTTADIISCPWPPAGTSINHFSGDVNALNTTSSLSAYGDASTPVSHASVDDSTLTGGGIAGVVLGCILVVVLLAIAVLVYRRYSTHKKKKSTKDHGDTQKPNADDPAYTSDTSISSSKRKESIGLLLSNDSGKYRIQCSYPAQAKNIYFEECEDSKQPLLKHSRQHQVWNDKDGKENHRYGPYDDSQLNNDDSCLEKSSNLKFNVEQDENELSDAVYKTFPLCRHLPRKPVYSSEEWKKLYGSDSSMKVKNSSASLTYFAQET